MFKLVTLHFTESLLQLLKRVFLGYNLYTVLVYNSMYTVNLKYIYYISYAYVFIRSNAQQQQQ